ncbi:hypothetical protein KJ975_08030 [Myxococcota bacterium]|nr:hypothetical protein [Myxococcota bacterium]
MNEPISHSVKKPCSFGVALLLLASCSSIRPTRLSVPVTEIGQVEKLARVRHPLGETLHSKGTGPLVVESVTRLRVITKDRMAVPIPVPFTAALTPDTLTLKGKKSSTRLKIETVDYLEVDARVKGPWRPTDYLSMAAFTVGALFCLAAISMIQDDD